MQVFGDQIEGTFDTISKLPCKYWGVATNTTSQQFGVNIAGEWSAATNEWVQLASRKSVLTRYSCGQWVNNVGVGSRYDGTYAGYKGPAPGTCDYWNDYTQWNASTKADLLHFVSASMDSLQVSNRCSYFEALAHSVQNYFFWTWKIGNSTTGTIEQINPFWNYQLGLAQGWIPADPRSAIGVCAGDGYDSNEFSGTYSSAWMTGGAGANTIPAAMSASYPWPAHNFTNVAAADMTSLPQFTQTGTPITMPGPTFTSPSSSATINVGNGWFNANHNRQAFAAISGCSYPAEYLAGNTVPTSACGAGLTQPMRRNTYPAPTAPPAR